eukprot:755186-Hanusia_phi.AAC.1
MAGRLRETAIDQQSQSLRLLETQRHRLHTEILTLPVDRQAVSRQLSDRTESRGSGGGGGSTARENENYWDEERMNSGQAYLLGERENC